MLLDCCLALTGNIWQVFHGLNSDTQLCCSTTKCFPTIRLFFQVALLHPRNNHNYFFAEFMILSTVLQSKYNKDKMKLRGVPLVLCDRGL